MTTFRLRSIFSSLQGEGRNAGRPCTFIRFATCNLACPWCDTKREEKMALRCDDLVKKVKAYKNKSVIITGGEPTVQPGLDELLVALKQEGFWIALETNGVIAPKRPEYFDYIAVSPKAEYVHRYADRVMLRKANEVRIVAVADDIDAFCTNMRTRIEATDYYISPLEQKGKMHYQRAIRLLEKVNKATPDIMPPWALSLQQHKILGIR